MSRVLVAMSGGVDSSLAAALALDEGHEVVGATMKLWGGRSDSGCCSVGDVEDARRVADHLGIDHHVFNFTEEFESNVVSPYVEAHANGLTPNPCIECNRHLKFGVFLGRALRLGFDLVATGHHARVSDGAAGPQLFRGADAAKDQSYVLSCLTRTELSRLSLPVGALTKKEVRAEAARRGLSTAAKADSQDVCFVAAKAGGRRDFLQSRLDLHPGRVRDERSGCTLGEVEAVELVTVGQRRGLNVATGGRRFVVEVDVTAREVVVGDEAALRAGGVELSERTWTGEPLRPGEEVVVQASAHGAAVPAVTTVTGVSFLEPRRRVAPGQTVALYDRATASVVLGSGIARREHAA